MNTTAQGLFSIETTVDPVEVDEPRVAVERDGRDLLAATEQLGYL